VLDPELIRMMRKILFAACISISVLPLNAQVLPPVNCTDALSICDSIVLQDTLKVVVDHSANEISNNSCLPFGEIRGTWYRLGVNTTGDLRFTITPLDTLADFDWALFQTNWGSCTDIFGVPSLEVSCNASGVGGGHYTTGASGLVQQGHSPAINITMPAVFYLYITTSIQDTDAVLGYKLDFSASDMDLVDCNEIGIEEETNFQLTVFPNPSHQMVYITSPHFIPVHYSITDITGQQVAVSSNAWKMEQGIDVAHFSAGIYYYCFTNDSGRKVSGKLAIN
jgi:hypothetical protein